MGERAIAEAGGGSRGLVLLVGHFALDAVVAGFAVLLVEAAIEALAGMLGVGVDRHCVILLAALADGVGCLMEGDLSMQSTSSCDKREE